ncbi:MAG: hypothetical protein NTX00_03165 [Candidatus Parcubacteria bacterium]|nr:hypothetical protein [Candidatus Parcubacteria bacterium]
MPEKRFGETPLYGTKTIFEAIKSEKESEGFEHAGNENLTSLVKQKDESFKEVPVQTLKKIEKKYKKIKNVKEVKLLTDPSDSNIVWVFLKTK